MDGGGRFQFIGNRWVVQSLSSAVAESLGGIAFMTPESSKRRVCSECGGTEIVEGIAVSQSAVSGEIGLSYKSLAFLTASAPLFADLCAKCGTVVRFYVRGTDKQWIKS